MENAKIEQMVRSVLAHELNVDAASIGEETSVENMPLWDSVKHVDIIFGILFVFEVRFFLGLLAKLTNCILFLQCVVDGDLGP